jgi:hypothetical protein
MAVSSVRFARHHGAFWRRNIDLAQGRREIIVMTRQELTLSRQQSVALAGSEKSCFRMACA